MNLIETVNKKNARKNIEKFPSVSVRISEGGKSRIQLFEGIVIATKGKVHGTDSHFRVRKTSSGTGVERVFPYHSPNVEAIKVLNRGKVRRAKHFYLRDRTGKAARIQTDYAQKN